MNCCEACNDTRIAAARVAQQVFGLFTESRSSDGRSGSVRDAEHCVVFARVKFTALTPGRARSRSHHLQPQHRL